MRRLIVISLAIAALSEPAFAQFPPRELKNLKVFPKDIQQALGLPLTKNVYYRDLSAEIQQELWRRFFEAIEPLRLTGKLGELDAAAEWFLDTATSTLYFWAPAGDSPALHLVEAKRRPTTFNLNAYKP